MASKYGVIDKSDDSDEEYEDEIIHVGDMTVNTDTGQIWDKDGLLLPAGTVIDSKGHVITDTFKDILTYNPDKAHRGDTMLNRNQSSIISILSSLTAKQAKIFSYVYSTTLMDINMKLTNSTNLGDFYNATWLALNVNQFLQDRNKEKMQEYVHNIATAAIQGNNWQPEYTIADNALTQQLVQVITDSSMKFVTSLGDDLKNQMVDILSTGLREGQPMQVIAGELENVLNISAGRAKAIARTEIMRAHTAMNYAAAKSQGAQYYIVDNRAEACEECQELYEGQVFEITDEGNLPPVHPNCACVPEYFDTSEEAQSWSDEIHTEKVDIRTDLEQEGLTINPNGTSHNTND